MLFKNQKTLLPLLFLLSIYPVLAPAESYLTITNNTNATIKCSCAPIDAVTEKRTGKPDTIFPIEAGKESKNEVRDWAAETGKNQILCFWNGDNKINQDEKICSTSNSVIVSGEFDEKLGKPITPLQISC